MNSSLKMVLPIGLIVLVVFGVTFLSSYSTPSPDDNPTENLTEDRPSQLLRLSRIEAKFDPYSDDPAKKFLTNIYEPGPEERATSFWFQNVNPFPVKLTVMERSCTSCTSARVATLSNDAVNDFVTRKNVGLPPVAPAFGLLPVPDLGAALASAALLQPLGGRWKEFDFTRKDEFAEVPAGSDKVPTWGVFQFGVKVREPGPAPPRTVTVGLQGAKDQSQAIRFTVHPIGIAPFRLTPPDINIGDLPEDGSPRTQDVYYWSATRGTGELPPPEVRLPPNDPLVAAGAAVPLTGSELRTLAIQIQGDPAKNAPLQITSAWRIPVTVLPKRSAGVPVPDIGPFERTIAVLGPGDEPGRVTLKGAVTGLVGLKDGTGLKFGPFDSRSDTPKDVTLASAKTDLELDTVPAEFKPVWLKVELGPGSTNGARREWSMKVTIPAESGYGDLPSDSAVVLKTREPNPRKIRIPVSGSAFRR